MPTCRCRSAGKRSPLALEAAAAALIPSANGTTRLAGTSDSSASCCSSSRSPEWWTNEIVSADSPRASRGEYKYLRKLRGTFGQDFGQWAGRHHLPQRRHLHAGDTTARAGDGVTRG